MFSHGKLVIFRIKARTDPEWKYKLYVGEVFEAYNRHEDLVSIHFYRNETEVHNEPMLPLEERVFLPVWISRKGSYVSSQPRNVEHNAHIRKFHPHEIRVLAANVNLQRNRKLPTAALRKVQKALDKYQQTEKF